MEQKMNSIFGEKHYLQIYLYDYLKKKYLQIFFYISLIKKKRIKDEKIFYGLRIVFFQKSP